MIICGNISTETIVVHPMDDLNSSHYIDITMGKNAPVFSVSCCCDDEWEWDFWYNKTNYDIVKYLIMDCIIGCDTIDELIDALDEAFDENCSDIVFDEDEHECDSDCANCEFGEY